MLRVFVARSDQKVQEEEEDPEALLHHEPGQHLVRSLTGPQVGLALSIIPSFPDPNRPLGIFEALNQVSIMIMQ